jgi:hypothetical protein
MRMLLTAWREATPGVRTLCLVLWCAGAVSLAAGAWGDTHGWWDRLGFLSNVASSATSGLFGVPLALVVLQHITVQQADNRERREVRHLAARLAAELATDARRLSRVAGMPALQAAFRDARMALTSGAQPPDADVLRRAYELWGEVVSPPVNSQVLLSRMAANWRSLRDEVRPRLVRVGGAWPDVELVNLLDETLSGSLSPEADLSWMDGVRHAAIDLGPAQLRQRRDVEAHLRRLEQADKYLRHVERAGRYADDIRRHFDAPDGGGLGDRQERSIRRW